MSNQNIDPVQAALDQAAANTQTQAQTAQPIEQNIAPNSATGVVQAQTTALAQPKVSAHTLTMDDAAVSAVSGVSGFIKLRDGGLELDEAKFGEVNFKVKIESTQQGGSFQPCYCHNYSTPAGQIYTKSYDNVTTASNSPAHSNLSWSDSVALATQKDPNSYTYLGFELTLELEKDTESLDKKTTLVAGTKFGYTTPYTASKQFKALWDKALSEGKRGQEVVVTLSGEEVSSPKGTYKKLIMSQVS